MKFYHFYNLPKPPEKYINLALTKEEENFGSRSEYNVPVLDKVNRYGQLITPNRNWRHELDKDFYKWVKENITLNFFDASIAMNIRENGYVTPHTDAKRNWCLIYVLDSGGDSCRTCFWQEKNKDVHRERYVLIDDYDKLELIESADFETNRWALFNTQVIHSVENIERKRVSIQISIDSITTNLYHEI